MWLRRIGLGALALLPTTLAGCTGGHGVDLSTRAVAAACSVSTDKLTYVGATAGSGGSLIYTWASRDGYKVRVARALKSSGYTPWSATCDPPHSLPTVGNSLPHFDPTQLPSPAQTP
jgi:hypothetical protein